MGEGMGHGIDQYIQKFISLDHPLLNGMKRDEQFRDDVQPSVAPEVGKLLGLLIRLIDARHVLELGTCLAYSTLWLGTAVKETGGQVVSVENDVKLFKEAQKNVERAGLAQHIDVIFGDVARVVPVLHGPFDMVFQDSRKSLYPQLLDHTIALTRVGGLIIADDTLFKVKGAPRSLGTATDAYNQQVFADQRLYSTLLPIGDGVTISYKLKES